LSDALAACDVLLFIEGPGPTPVKTTLAASLASGTAVVALDGPHTWPELIQSEAARVVAPAADVLADALADLLTDRDRREALAARGLAFAKRNMAVERNADAIARLVEDLVSRTPS
jgi:glycosyltransferase involved in cell wall biosynthesis